MGKTTSLRMCFDQCHFCFIETGSNFIKDGRQYKIQQKTRQSVMAFKSGMNFVGKPIKFYLETKEGPVLENNLYRPHYRKNCVECGARLICNGCSDCGRCSGEIIALQKMNSDND